MKIREHFNRRFFLALNYVLCILVALICLLPLLHVLATSFSSKAAIIAGRVTLFPVEPTLINYKYVADDINFYRSFFVSIQRTALAMVIHMSLTLLAAYPLSMSKYRFHARSIYTWFFMIAMLFSGGLIPTYMVVTRTKLLNTIWALVIPGAVPIFNVILMQNFMKSLPQEIMEAASIDGAGQLRTLASVVLPLCKVSIATVSLFVIVDNWNAWFDGMIYIDDMNLFPLQTYLRTVIVQIDYTQVTDPNDIAKLVANAGTNAAKIFIAMAPVLAVYPFVQKYFVKGIVLGSVKE